MFQALTDTISRRDLRPVPIVLAICVMARAAVFAFYGRAQKAAGHFRRAWITLTQRSSLTGVRYALDAVPVGLLFCDADQRIRTWNAPFYRMMADCGLSLEIGMSRRRCGEAVAAAGWFGETALGAPREAAEVVGLVRKGQTEWRRADDRWIKVEVFTGHDGGTVMVVNDITESKAAAAMAVSRDAAEAARRAQTDFLTTMSHEIRTPLNGVLGMAEVLMRTSLSAEQRRLMSVIQRSGKLLDLQLTDMLELAHPGQSAQPRAAAQPPAAPVLVAAPAEAAPEPRLEPEWKSEAEPVGGGRFRVLVVDDNAVNRQVLEMILDSVGLEHGSVENGQESVEAMMTGGYDAVLMDIQMPVMDGLEATRRIRAWEAEGRRPRSPIIIVSANGLKEHVDAGRAAGADAHLNKPISVAALIGAIAPYAEEAERVAA